MYLVLVFWQNKNNLTVIGNEELNLENKLNLKQEEFTEKQAESLHKARKTPLTTGILWTDSVAEYFLEVYPDLFEEGMTLAEIFHFMYG